MLLLLLLLLPLPRRSATPRPFSTMSTNFGFGDEQLQQLESNYEGLKQQDEKLNEAHGQLLLSLLNKELADTGSLGDVLFAVKVSLLL